MPNDLKKSLFTVLDVAALLSISKSKMWQLISTGDIATVKLGRSTRIKASEIERFMNQLPGGHV